MKEMALVVSNLIRELERVKSDLYQTEFTFHNYISYNKDEKKFKKYLEKVVNEQRKEIVENRTRDSLSDNK
jgi:hypothetical protein